jgi:hypothetical protein
MVVHPFELARRSGFLPVDDQASDLCLAHRGGNGGSSLLLDHGEFPRLFQFLEDGLDRDFGPQSAPVLDFGDPFTYVYI